MHAPRMVSYPQRAPSALADAGRGKMYFLPAAREIFYQSIHPPEIPQQGQA